MASQARGQLLAVLLRPRARQHARQRLVAEAPHGAHPRAAAAAAAAARPFAVPTAAAAAGLHGVGGDGRVGERGLRREWPVQPQFRVLDCASNHS